MTRLHAWIAGVAALLLATTPARALDKWTSQADAVQKLWAARLDRSAAWPAAQCNDWAGLNPKLKAEPAAVSNTTSGLVVPKVSVNHPNLANGLRQLATSLLNYNLTANTANTFYPPQQDGPLVLNAALWSQLARTPHGNDRNHLPSTNPTALNSQLNQCPNLDHLNRGQVLDALAATPISNSLRWHCYSRRFAAVNNTTIPLTGYVEFTHKELQYENQYAEAESAGRLVFDYINKRVFYTPAHYRQWLKTNFSISDVGGYGCPAQGTCCDPFFELVL